MKTVFPTLRMSLLGVMLALGPMAAVQAKTPADQLIVGMSMVNLFSIDPANAPGLDASGINANLYDTLIKRDNGSPEKHLPQLAERWTVSDDGKQITFNLRTDVKFHSGNPLTAEDVAWSLYRVMKLNFGLATTWKAYGYSTENIQSLIRATDKHTLVVDLPQPTNPLLVIDSLAVSPSAVIVDRVEALKHEKNGDLGAAWLVTNAAGSGPFTLTKWSANDSLVMTRFDGYWGGPAKMKRVLVRHMTESQSLRLMLERGDLDLAYGIAAPDIKAIESNKKLQVQALTRGTMYYVAMSMKQPEFANKKVREAVRNLIDYKGLDEQVMPHYGTLNQRPMQLGLEARLPDPGYKMDVAKAKALLTEAGYPQGFSTTIRTLSEPPFIDIAARMQSTLAEGGIKASIITGTGNQVYGAMRARNFDMIVARGAERYPHPYFSLRVFAYNPDNSDNAGLPNFQGWRASFFDQQINELVDRLGEERDADKRLAMYHQAQNRYEQEVGPIMVISQMTDTAVSAVDVKGFTGDDAEATRYLGVYKQR
ncbi:ABC transporter substrate-binding protein [Pseudomonas sp. 21LCFQ02]|uniref:ABC transporter substrate-binding protein n=1 Tax=unclassified Pseudomonas TaxID=196821 RepID=UPI0004F8AFD0|nr:MULTISPECIES: ABC transporter substrate-binding protein [unclassified Pseudomonas]MCO8163144.1 ABC transporter substrate-binding protein [Pseudomonas sp. 21LCFQ010]MCO8168490.1 ABC transporter substrate-binding protein [Pseudomonas sp. 21LCFQ02]MCQ9424133.1 ABC transporter substrate-binding protein [Pseudomonas sp. LJDD11]BAP40988.1 extracellular solute-binding protein, family [Pseudomonas sp. StFLB209]